MIDNYYDDNDLCEICYANNEPDYSICTFDILFINTHCIELRRNRLARKNKNTQPKVTGKRIEMPASGQMPGNTPTSVPTRQPRNANQTFAG